MVPVQLLTIKVLITVSVNKARSHTKCLTSLHKHNITWYFIFKFISHTLPVFLLRPCTTINNLLNISIFHFVKGFWTKTLY